MAASDTGGGAPKSGGMSGKRVSKVSKKVAKKR
jgi:hypothetical protein